MPHLQEAVAAGLRDWPIQPRVVIGEQEKRSAFRIAHAALAKSGTVTLELALAGSRWSLPTGPAPSKHGSCSEPFASDSVILANLVIGENVVPEFIQEDCRADKLMPALREILSDTPLRRRQAAAFAGIDAIMSTGRQSPSVRAADIVLATMQKARR